MTTTTTITTTIISGHPKPRFRHPTTLVHPPPHHFLPKRTYEQWYVRFCPRFQCPDLFRHPTARFRHPTPLSTPQDTPFDTSHPVYDTPAPFSTPHTPFDTSGHPDPVSTPNHACHAAACVPTPHHSLPKRTYEQSYVCFPLFSHLRRVYEQRTHISFYFLDLGVNPSHVTNPVPTPDFSKISFY